MRARWEGMGFRMRMRERCAHEGGGGWPHRVHQPSPTSIARAVHTAAAMRVGVPARYHQPPRGSERGGWGYG